MTIGTLSLVQQQVYQLQQDETNFKQKLKQEKAHAQDQNKVERGLDEGAVDPKNTLGSNPAKPVGAQYAYLEALASLMDENQKVMGEQANQMGVLETPIEQLTSQLSVINNEQELLPQESSSDALADSVRINTEMTALDAQIGNLNTTGEQSTMSLNFFTATNNAMAALAQAMISEVLSKLGRFTTWQHQQ